MSYWRATGARLLVVYKTLRSSAFKQKELRTLGKSHFAKSMENKAPSSLLVGVYIGASPWEANSAIKIQTEYTQTQ